MDMMKEKMNFGKYIEGLRKSRQKSLRETAKAIGVSPQYYSEVEKGRRGALTPDRLKLLASFLLLDSEEIKDLYDIQAEEKSNDDNIVVPQDCVNYVVSNQFVLEALRLSQETGAGEAEWKVLLDELKTRKGQIKVEV